MIKIKDIANSSNKFQDAIGIRIYLCDLQNSFLFKINNIVLIDDIKYRHAGNLTYLSVLYRRIFKENNNWKIGNWVENEYCSIEKFKEIEICQEELLLPTEFAG